MLIPLECWTWENARCIPYSLNFGYVEGLEANGVECLMIPSQLMGEKAESDLATSSWLKHIDKVCEGKRFDQVWFELVHSYLDDSFLDWMVSRIPIRVGFMYESLEISDEEYAGNAAGSERRRANVSKHLTFTTHVACVDENDVEVVKAQTSKPVIWGPGAVVVPRFVSDPLPVSTRAQAIFFGALYGKRRDWLEHPELRNLLHRPESSPEMGTEYHGLFDKLQIFTKKSLEKGDLINQFFLLDYLRNLRSLREKLTIQFMTGLQSGCAVVNLPQFGRIYASRVVEGIACGRPVIAAEIPHCPRTKALFEDGKEILLYSPDDPAHLASHIRKIQQEPTFASGIVSRAQHRLQSCYSTETWVRQLLQWIDTGKAPSIEKVSPSFKRAYSVPSLIGDSMISDPKDLKRESTILAQLRSSGLWSDEQPLRLHLGCGEQHFEGYINIDHPPSEHNVMVPNADIFWDLQHLHFPNGSVDEIRSHHMFEHFSRVEALALLIRWHQWLKVGGRLRIETPDFWGSAETFLHQQSLKVKMGAVRHLAGDQSSNWGYHLDHWFPQRFDHTFKKLGFESVETRSWSWEHEPFLANVEAVGMKERHLSTPDLLQRADELLWESTVADNEKPTYEVWRRQLRQVLSRANSSELSMSHNKPLAACDFGVSATGRTPDSSSISTDAKQASSIHEMIQEGDLVFDVGANVGSKAEGFLQQGARVVCFEPQPDCLQVLRSKFGDHSNIWIEDKGLAEQDGQLQLSICQSANTISTFAEEWKHGRFSDYAWDQACSVDVTTLDAMIQRHGCPKFCKIDVEGFEWSVLKGLSQPIPFIAFEFTIEFLHNARRCIAHLQSLGYQEFNLALGENSVLSLSEWVGADALFHFIQEVNVALLWGDIYARTTPLSNPDSTSRDSVSFSECSPRIGDSSVSLSLPQDLLLKTANIPLSEIHGFNQNDRDAWVRSKARTVLNGSHVLDIGAGTCPYRDFFSHCEYKTHDFKQYDGVKLGNTKEYGHIDYVSDISAIPVPDHSFDVVLCSEVLEHVPEPIKALQEMARILKPEGRLFLTAPLGSGLHQLPFHFYGGYTPEWYKHFGKKFDLQVIEIVPNGRFFKLLAQECARVAWTFDQHQHLHGEDASTVYQLFNEWLPRYLSWMDDQCPNEQFTVGYHVEMVLKPVSVQLDTEQVDLLEQTRQNHRNPSAFVSLAKQELKRANPRRASRYVKAALALDPSYSEAEELMEILSR